MKVDLKVAAVLLTAGVLAMCAGCEGVSRTSWTAPSTAVKDERALTALKGMSDVLAKAGAMSFRADAAEAVKSPTGQWVHVFGTSQVTLRRPDKLFVATRGDMFPQDFYFDGKTVTMYAPKEKLYATEDIPGGVDQTLLQVFQKHGTYFSFADVILSIPEPAMTRDLTSAQYVGQSTVGGVETKHLAFTGSGMEWELWIGESDQLPRLLNVTYTSESGQPTCSVAFADWQLAPATTENTFAFTPPAGAARIEFRKLESQAGK